MDKHCLPRAGSIILVLFSASLMIGAGAPARRAAEGCATGIESFAHRPGPISAVWANDGGDKVASEELRTARACRRVLNKTWDGSQVRLFGAVNETVSFNLVLEAAHEVATAVSVSFDHLTHKNGEQIRAARGTRENIFDWRGRDIALYYVRYLPIKGLSLISYDTYDERHIPERLRRPHSPDGEARGTWTDRPDHEMHYPDIAVPIELVPQFNIEAGTNQSIWIDVYIPEGTPPGRFSGNLLIKQQGNLLYNVPVTLDVMGFALPHQPAVRAFAATSYEDIAGRYTGTVSPEPQSRQDALVQTVAARQAQLAQRHRIELIDNNGGAEAWNNDAPRRYWLERFSGELFSQARGYRGPGMGIGTSLFSIGTFGTWQSWLDPDDKQKMWRFTDGWETWFRNHAPHVERFLYLADEPEDLDLIERRARVLKANPARVVRYHCSRRLISWRRPRSFHRQILLRAS